MAIRTFAIWSDASNPTEVSVIAPSSDLVRRAAAQSMAQRVAWLLPVLLLAIPIAYGAYKAFPLYDDGWISLLMREHGDVHVAGTMPDRPFYAWVMMATLLPEPFRRAGMVGLTLLLWIGLAWIAVLFWKALFPSLARFSPAAACAVIAPVVVTCQLTTIVTSLQLIPPILVLGAVLLLLRYVQENGAWRMPVAVLAVIVGALFSEYAVPSGAAGLVLLCRPLFFGSDAKVRRRALTAAMALGVTLVVSYVAYMRLGDIRFRPSVNPAVQVSSITRDPLAPALNLLNGTWHSILGAYGYFLGQIQIDHQSKSTILSVAFAILFACGLIWICAGRKSENEDTAPTVIDGAVLVAAVAFGLLPVAIMGRSTAMIGFGSRFLIPILPLAAAATLAIAFHFIRGSHRWVVVGVLGLIFAYTTPMTVHGILQEHALMTKIGKAVQPLLSTAGGYTVAVVDRGGIDYEFTAKVTQSWPVAQSSKFWLYDEASGRKNLGGRQKCDQPQNISKEQRSVVRSGPIDKVLWIETNDFKIGSIEPYCRAVTPAQP